MKGAIAVNTWVALGVFVGLLALAGETAFADVIYVDGTFTGFSDGSETNPYTTINDGIGAAIADDTVKVKPGVYLENVYINKNLTLSGTGPDTTAIKGNGGVALLIDANLTVTVEKFTITSSGQSGIALQKSNASVEVVIRNVVSVGHPDYGFYQRGGCTAHVTIENSTFAANGQSGTFTQSATIRNCISANNGQYGHRTHDGGNSTRVSYCNAFNNPDGGWHWAQVTNSIGVEPQFIDSDTGDHRLWSTSPCRNAGTPDAPDRNPDGSRNDMGAYGGSGSAGFYNGYGSGPVVTDLLVVPGSVPFTGTFNVTATGHAE